jgi:hypothetical protein
VPNDVLRRALADARLTPAGLASRLCVDPETVQRWVADEGRTPQPRHRWAVADALGVDEMSLWPNAARAALKVGPDREIQAVYPSHSAMPPAVWQRLVGDATREIMLCGTSPHWLWYYVPDLTSVLRGKAGSGVRVRVVIGDPDSPLVVADEEATGAALQLSTRIRETEHRLEPLRGAVEVRRTAMGFGRSVYRGDAAAVADWWLHGQPGTDFPVLHLVRRQSGGIFDQVAVRHAEALWEAARPVWE